VLELLQVAQPKKGCDLPFADKKTIFKPAQTFWAGRYCDDAFVVTNITHLAAYCWKPMIPAVLSVAQLINLANVVNVRRCTDWVFRMHIDREGLEINFAIQLHKNPDTDTTDTGDK
jgi:hypothetical protein